MKNGCENKTFSKSNKRIPDKDVWSKDQAGYTVWFSCKGRSYERIWEGVLIYKAIKQQGFEVKLSHNFSGIPSTTEAFRVEMAKLGSKIGFTEINKPKQIRISGNERFMWSYFPDVMLDKIQVGHTVISSLESMYKTSQDILMKILSKLTCSKVVILSDHGYIRSEAGFAFTVPESIKKNLRDILGGNRYIPMNDIDASNLVRDGYLCEFSGFYLVKSRYIWPVPGKYSLYLHGGLSLMECMTPIIEVKK